MIDFWVFTLNSKAIIYNMSDWKPGKYKNYQPQTDDALRLRTEDERDYDAYVAISYMKLISLRSKFETTRIDTNPKLNCPRYLWWRFLRFNPGSISPTVRCFVCVPSGSHSLCLYALKVINSYLDHKSLKY